MTTESVIETGAPRTMTFRYLPGFLAIGIGLGLFFAWTLGRMMLDPDVLSAKGALLFVLMASATLGLWSAIVTLWRLHWKFVFTPTQLVATHALRRERVEIPWEAIRRVRKRPRPWWARGGGGGLGVSEIETVDGKTVPFMTHLMLRYDTFLSELKARATNCKEFAPYHSEFE